MVLAIILSMFSMCTKATVINVVSCPNIITFEVPDGNIFYQYGDGLKVGDEIIAIYNPATKEFHVDW